MVKVKSSTLLTLVSSIFSTGLDDTVSKSYLWVSVYYGFGCLTTHSSHPATVELIGGCKRGCVKYLKY